LSYLDSHCHLDLFDNMPAFLHDWYNYDLSIITMTTTPLAYKKNQELFEKYPKIYVALGLHPQLIVEREKELNLLLNHIEKAKFIGEIGLDLGPRYYKSINAQIQALIMIIDRCDWYGDKIVSVHSLRSAEIVLEILRSNIRNQSNKYIMHWFTGSSKALDEAVELGCFFSINSRMLQSKLVRKNIVRIPKEKILLESDAPFTIKFSSSKDHCSYINQMVKMICEIKEEDISAQIKMNGNILLS